MLAPQVVDPCAPATTTVAASTTTVPQVATTVPQATTATTVPSATTTVAATTTTVALACASGGSCAVGDTGPGGGIVFYDAGSVQSWGRYLEAAPFGDEVQRTWATGGNQSAAVSGADGTANGTGEQNTADIFAQSGNVEVTSAAVYCSGLVSGGQSDWFLPSKDELNLMYTNLHSASTPLGGFSSVYYWSSSESAAGHARIQGFDSGSQYSDRKTSTYFVRPVRAFG